MPASPRASYPSYILPFFILLACLSSRTETTLDAAQVDHQVLNSVRLVYGCIRAFVACMRAEFDRLPCTVYSIKFPLAHNVVFGLRKSILLSLPRELCAKQSYKIANDEIIGIVSVYT